VEGTPFALTIEATADVWINTPGPGCQDLTIDHAIAVIPQSPTASLSVVRQSVGLALQWPKLLRGVSSSAT